LNSVIRCSLGYPNPDKCAKLMDELRSDHSGQTENNAYL
jgi:hypothetical protein